MALTSAWPFEPNKRRLQQAYALMEKNPTSALNELIALADLGSSGSMVFLGYYFYKEANPTNLAEAEKWFKKSCETGSLIGLFHLGCFYLNTGNYTEAERIFLDGDHRNYPPATYWLARLYYRYPPGWNRYAEARSLLERAQRNGHMWAKRDLGKLYMKGTFGIAKIPRGLLFYISAAKDFVKEFRRDEKSLKLRYDAPWNEYE